MDVWLGKIQLKDDGTVDMFPDEDRGTLDAGARGAPSLKPSGRDEF